MPDLSTTRPTQRLGLAGREWREVIVVHKSLALALSQAIQHLLLTWRTQRHHAQYLRLTAGENRRAMCARQQPNFTTDRTNGFQIAPVRTKTMVQNIIADICLQFLF